MSPPDWSGALLYPSAFACGYLLGSIPFGLILAKLFGLGDLRQIGSGNIGATNVLRAGSKWLAAHWGEEAAILAGLGAFLGHLFPVWLGFRGGKGVATYIGVLLGLYWPAAAAFCVIWLVVAFATRYSSLSALVASGGSVCVLVLTGQWRLAALFLLLTVLLYIRHASNIGRLARGEEARIGESKP